MAGSLVWIRGPHFAVPTPDRLIAHPEELPRAYAVTVIGDVRVDIRGTLGHRFVELDTDVHESVTLTTSVGGTGMSFARAAAPTSPPRSSSGPSVRTGGRRSSAPPSPAAG